MSKKIRESKTDIRITRLPLKNPDQYVTRPEDALHVDLVPELLPSGGYEKKTF